MASDGTVNCRWTCVVWLYSLTAAVHQAVAGSCGSSDSNKRQQENDKCWYELWYFWFIIVLVFLTIVILTIFYCKQQVKRSSNHRRRRRTPVLTMPMAPPLYDAPGHQPPPYHIAMATATTVPDSNPSVATVHGGNRAAAVAGNRPPASAVSRSSQRPPPSLPGYIIGDDESHGYDNLSLSSTASAGVVSNPPPYSPPHSAYVRQGQRYHADVPL